MENNQNMEMQNTVETITEQEMEGMRMNTRRRQRIILVAVLLICAAIFATGTMAYFTAEETAYNVITTAKLDMELVEKTTGGADWPEGGISGVMPGTEVDKLPYVENRGGIAFWTRMSVSVKVEKNGKELSDKYVSLNIDKENWELKDGFYYYKHAVKPGEQTKPLFTKVIFDEDMHNEYQNATTYVEVVAQAVQSAHNGASALEAKGWSNPDAEEGND